MGRKKEPVDHELRWETADPRGVLTGVHFINGDAAACEGALAAGCRFVAGYPITPSTEVVERYASRIPTIGGVLLGLGVGPQHIERVIGVVKAYQTRVVQVLCRPS